jgi:predicted nucleic acid-binding protein
VKIMGILNSFKRLFNKEENTDNSIEDGVASNIIYEIDEEDRIVVALAVAAIAGQDKPNSEFHISKITRIR